MGYNPTLEMYDPALAHSLKYNIAQFSAFKETSFRKQLEAALTSNGKVTPWSEFKKKADELHVAYNRRWLKTEYDHTVATANMAQQWQDFEADADLYPNLRYNAVGDARTREQHKAWDGLILPLNHSFWKTHLPPNDWGCRCNVEQTNDAPTVEPPKIATKGAFNNNAALSGKVFAENAYEKGLSAAEGKQVEKQADKNFNKLLQKETKERLVDNKVSVKRKELSNSITFTSSGIKEAFNQPHYNKTSKNLLISKIDEVLKTAKYLGSRKDFKENKMVTKIHIFEILIDDKKTYLINRELVTGEIHFYSVSDGEAILKGIKK